VSKAPRQHTIEVEGFGSVTFKPLGKVAMSRIAGAVERGGVRGWGSTEAKLREMEASQARRNREDALIFQAAVIEPRFETDEALAAAFKSRGHLIAEIAQAVRERSWPN
jgi:hypothetical protein